MLLRHQGREDRGWPGQKRAQARPHRGDHRKLSRAQVQAGGVARGCVGVKVGEPLRKGDPWTTHWTGLACALWMAVPAAPPGGCSQEGQGPLHPGSIHPGVGCSTWVTQGGCCGAGQVEHPLRFSAGPRPLSSGSRKRVQGPGFPGPAGQVRGDLGQRGWGSGPCRGSPDGLPHPARPHIAGCSSSEGPGCWAVGLPQCTGPGATAAGPPRSSSFLRPMAHTGGLAAPWPVLLPRCGV